jgi:hypothetical protein
VVSTCPAHALYPAPAAPRAPRQRHPYPPQGGCLQCSANDPHTPRQRHPYPPQPPCCLTTTAAEAYACTLVPQHMGLPPHVHETGPCQGLLECTRQALALLPAEAGSCPPCARMRPPVLVPTTRTRHHHPPFTITTLPPRAHHLHQAAPAEPTPSAAPATHRQKHHREPVPPSLVSRFVIMGLPIKQARHRVASLITSLLANPPPTRLHGQVRVEVARPQG